MEGYGPYVGESDLADIFMRRFKRKIGETKKAGGGVPGRVHLGYYRLS